MLWLACAVVAVSLIVLSVKIYIANGKGVFRVVYALTLLTLAVYIAYIPPFHYAYGLLPGAVANLVHVLRVITVDADITEMYSIVTNGIINGTMAQAYIIMLGILHVLLPSVSAFTAITVLLRCFSSMQIFVVNRHKRPVFVFSEINERSVHLAKSLEQLKCDIVFANSIADSINSRIITKNPVVYKDGDITELPIRVKNKDSYFFCISSDENASLGNLLQITERFSLLDKSEQKHIHIYQFSKSQDFSLFVDSTDKGAMDVQCINEYDLLIYNLLDRYPLMRYGKTGIHVLLYGLSDVHIAALKAVIWCGQISNFSLRVSAVGINIKDRIEDLQMKIPGIFTGKYDVHFYDCANEKEMVDTVEFECADANYIIVAGNTDNTTLEQSVSLRRLFYKMDSKKAACPPIFCYINDPSKFNLVRNLATAESNAKRKVSYDLTPFGSLDEIFTYEELVNSPLEKLAKNVHLAYEEIFSDIGADVEKALDRYNIFEVNKRSNRASALHIRYKLNMLGLDYTGDQSAETVRLDDYYTEDALHGMSIAEHNRWMAFLETEGWTKATMEEVLAYRNSGISRGRHNCPILKMHPYICEYEKLKGISLKLEGKDTTLYDREMIKKIPDILNDKWNIAGKRYKIVRK